MTKIIETNVDKLIPDDKNFNKGTEYGQHLIEESLRKFGAGRSILLDKNNRIIAGNKTVENAAIIGIDNVIIVETDGNQIVAVKRKDIDLDTAKGRELALADNATGKLTLHGMLILSPSKPKDLLLTRKIGAFQCPNLKQKNRKTPKKNLTQG